MLKIISLIFSKLFNLNNRIKGKWEENYSEPIVMDGRKIGHISVNTQAKYFENSEYCALSTEKGFIKHDGYSLKPGHLWHPFAERRRSEQTGWPRRRSSANGHAVPSKMGSQHDGNEIDYLIDIKHTGNWRITNNILHIIPDHIELEVISISINSNNKNPKDSQDLIEIFKNLFLERSKAYYEIVFISQNSLLYNRMYNGNGQIIKGSRVYPGFQELFNFEYARTVNNDPRTKQKPNDIVDETEKLNKKIEQLTKNIEQLTKNIEQLTKEI